MEAAAIASSRPPGGHSPERRPIVSKVRNASQNAAVVVSAEPRMAFALPESATARYGIADELGMAACKVCSMTKSTIHHPDDLVLVAPEVVTTEHVRLNAHRVLTIARDSNDRDALVVEVLAHGLGLSEWILDPTIDDIGRQRLVRRGDTGNRVFLCTAHAAQCIVEQLFFHAWSGGVGFVGVDRVSVNYHRCLCDKCFSYAVNFRRDHVEEHCRECLGGAVSNREHDRQWIRERRKGIDGWLGYEG